ncbi:MAG: hypothetical protein J6S83_14460 [Lachnospiraceae bacterium]|nr:hypothetical protein [Lachnospiraceae bacterium]
MAVNPMAMLKYKERIDQFNADHPKVRPFLAAVTGTAMQEGTVLEIRATTPDGRELVTNIRLNANDIETLRMLHNER